MDEKTFTWTEELTKKLFKIRFENNLLFEKRKQPWLEFHKILLNKGFPEEMTVNHVRKKWSYHFETYKLAKTSNKTCKYYKLFDKHFGNLGVVDKFSSWPNEWRFKLITIISNLTEQKLDHESLWRSVEREIRSQNMPEDCCVHDMKGLWHHLKKTFIRKFRISLKKTKHAESWPLYESMLDYYNKYEPETLARITTQDVVITRTGTKKYVEKCRDENYSDGEFHWTKDITESFIQIRLQNDWLFREKGQPWKAFVDMLYEQYGFPRSLGVAEVRKKWTSTYAEYQKAKATKLPWRYYNLFELYLDDGSFTVVPAQDWKEEWLYKMINIRTKYEKEFQYYSTEPSRAWRLVEKSLRTMGLPLTHCLLDLPKIWAYLCRTFRWKRKFAMKGMLNENWTFYDAMAKYQEVHDKNIKIRTKDKQEEDFDDDFDDDIKLYDLKQQLDLQVKPKVESEYKCRTCANVETYEQCVDIFEYRDGDTDLASKLKAVGGIGIDKSDGLTNQICFNCLRELENAYNFRMKCQNSDRLLRDAHAQEMQKIKMETVDIEFEDQTYEEDTQHNDTDRNDDIEQIVANVVNASNVEETNIIKKESIVKPRKKYKRYEYWRVCEICGKNTRNLSVHLESHSSTLSHTCEICDKKFKFKSNLNIHKRIHNPKLNRKTCDVCGKQFTMMAQYKRHYAYHANERKFACDTCGKRFNSMDVLRIHIRIHSDERAYSCPECGKSFRTSGCVSRHRRIVHRNIKKNNN